MVIGAFLFPKVFTGVADAAASGAAARGFVAVFGFAVGAAASVPCARTAGTKSTDAPRINANRGMLSRPTQRDPDSVKEFNPASPTICIRKRRNIAPRLYPTAPRLKPTPL